MTAAVVLVLGAASPVTLPVAPVPGALTPSAASDFSCARFRRAFSKSSVSFSLATCLAFLDPLSLSSSRLGRYMQKI